MREARCMCLISWTLRSGSEHVLHVQYKVQYLSGGIQPAQVWKTTAFTIKEEYRLYRYAWKFQLRQVYM